jgi:predicted nucleic acid-binding protein
MKFVLDASVALCWCLGGEGEDYALRVLDRLRRAEAIVPALWPAEVTNGLIAAERRKRIGPGDAASARRLILALPVSVDPVDQRRSFQDIPRLARAYGLTAYDASYLELALRLEIPLATLNTPVSDAAADEGVAVVD